MIRVQFQLPFNTLLQVNCYCRDSVSAPPILWSKFVLIDLSVKHHLAQLNLKKSICQCSAQLQGAGSLTWQTGCWIGLKNTKPALSKNDLLYWTESRVTASSSIAKKITPPGNLQENKPYESKLVGSRLVRHQTYSRVARSRYMYVTAGWYWKKEISAAATLETLKKTKKHCVCCQEDSAQQLGMRHSWSLTNSSGIN